MASANVTVTSLVDTGWEAKVGLLIGPLAAANTVNALAVQANTLKFANATVTLNPLSISRVDYSAGISSGTCTLQWVSSVNTNTPIWVFGANTAGTLQACEGNSANTPTGDINLYLNGMVGYLNLIIYCNKDRGTPYAWANADILYGPQVIGSFPYRPGF